MLNTLLKSFESARCDFVLDRHEESKELMNVSLLKLVALDPCVEEPLLLPGLEVGLHFPVVLLLNH